jgi:hypothetical protein
VPNFQRLLAPQIHPDLKIEKPTTHYFLLLDAEIPSALARQGAPLPRCPAPYSSARLREVDLSLRALELMACISVYMLQ